VQQVLTLKLIGLTGLVFCTVVIREGLKTGRIFNNGQTIWRSTRPRAFFGALLSYAAFDLVSLMFVLAPL
jgi:hypothetical protein